MSLFPIGTKLLIDGPHGNGLDLSTTYKNKKPLLLIGAGSAITTIRNVVHSISKDQECNILYSAKSIKDIPYLDEVNQWKMNPNNYFSLTQEASPDFHHGRINSHLEMRNITGNTNILLCGPDSFIRETALLLLEKHGHEKENIFVSLNDKNAKDGPIYQLTDAILERLKPTISEDAEDSAKKKRLSNS